MKKIIYMIMLAALFAGNAIAQNSAADNKNNEEPLAILNGKIITSAMVKKLDLSAIKGMWVLKDRQIQAKYGEAGRNGVIFISTQTEELTKADTSASTEPLILLDSVEIGADTLKKILPDNIKEIQVFKDSQATNKYGIKAAKGLVLVTSKKPLRLVSFATVGPNNPLLLVDGVESDIKELEKIKPENILKMQVYTDAAATAVYGIKGAHGVILVTTKNKTKTKN